MGKSPHKDLYGKVFADGKLMVISHPCKIEGAYYYNVMCYCGIRTFVMGHSLTSGKIKSCGCYKIEKLKKGDHCRTHDLSYTVEYKAWTSMISRCYNENNVSYKNYGGRGIVVCDRWRYSVKNFVKDMGLKPSSDMSLDRINNNGNYEITNCRWSTSIEQNNNQRRNYASRHQETI